MAIDNLRRSASGALTPFPDNLAPEPGPALQPAGPSFRETPFLSEYPESEGEGGDAEAEMLDELLESLHEPELDEAIEALVEELRGQVAADPAFETESDETRDAMMRETLAPLAEALRADVARVSEALQGLDLASASEEEIDEAVDATPLPELGNPAFEQLFSGLRKKLKKIAGLAKGVLSPALGLLIKPLMAQLGKLAMPLVQKVAAYALDKVPDPYKPLARQLAARLKGQVVAAATTALGGAAPAAASAPVEAAPAPAAEPAAAPVPQDPATPDTAQAQHELDLALAEVVLANGRVDQEVIESGADRRELVARDPYAELARARERFVREITEVEGEEEAEVVIERFLPAVMFAVGQGIRWAGRSRVVEWLARPIAAILRPLIGKDNAPTLAKVLADVGLRTFFHAEVDAGTEREAAGRTIAAAVEETARRVAQLPEELFEEPEALASYVHEAIEGAVAANFPASLVRPELRETERPGAWVLLPARGRKRVKKFSKVFDVCVTPAVASAVRGYGTSTLAGLFRDRLRLPHGATVNARLHLYEAVPGTSLAAISRTEEARGLGSADPEVTSQIQPLTPQAALLLLDSPRLGRELPEDAKPGVPGIGQRLYYLEVPGAPPRPLGRECRISIGVHPGRGEIRLALYLSEVVAQKVASALRARKPAAAVLTELRALLAPTASALGHAGSVVRIHGARWHRGGRGVAAGAARQALRRQIASLALRWAWKHLAGSLDAVGADFIAKTDGPEDGVRLVFTFHVPGGLAGFGRVFRGLTPHVAGWPPSAPSRTTLVLHAGPRHV